MPRGSSTCRWFCEDLPGAVAARDPPHLAAEELVKLVEYKLLRGKWRPNLLDYARAVSQEQIQELTTQALQKSACISKDGDEALKEAMQPLLKMKVCKPSSWWDVYLHGWK